MNEEARQALLLGGLSDKSSAIYRGMVKVLEDCEGAERRSRQVKPYVVIPFPVDEQDVVKLEEQFSIAIAIRGSTMRVVATPRVAALMFLIESALVEHASGCNRTTLIVDGDVMTAAAVGYEGKLIERTHATPRLATGYHMEDNCLRHYGSSRGGKLNVSADNLASEQYSGGGEHYWPCVRAVGPRVDSIVFNHFKTPAGAKQVAWLAACRGAVVYGAIFFQFDMLTSTHGELECFPGHFYIDREADVITLVPKKDATMSISHPYSSWLEIFTNNSVKVGGREYLCEKYKSVAGVMYYTMNPIEHDFEAPEVLRTNYFDPSQVGVTDISFPKVKLSKEGVPVGWTRGSVRMLTSRCERVMSRIATSESAVVHPREVMVALMDYNNTSPVSLDTVKTPHRMPVEEEEDVALALALHVNWVRHQAKGTFNTLLNAIKLRYEVKDFMLYKFAYIALSAWWSKPSVRDLTSVGELPVSDVVDWCGRDFSVVISDANPWVVIEQRVGDAVEYKAKMFTWLPQPPVVRDASWLRDIVTRVKVCLMTSERSNAPTTIDTELVVSRSKPRSYPFKPVVKSSACAPVLSLVDEFEAGRERPVHQLTDGKKKLVAKMIRDQGAVDERVAKRYVLARGGMAVPSGVVVPVPDVEPVSAIRDDLLMCNKGVFERDAVTTGYRIAEVDIDKRTEGSFSINDAKRLIPRQRWVRKPKIDAGVEGKRVSSQAALIGALFKRNIGVPSNRGFVNLDDVPKMSVDRIVQVCYRDDWQEVVDRHLNSGMWESNASDIEDFVGNIDEKKVRGLLDEFFLEGYVNLERWLLMAKGKIKASRDAAADSKVDHSQTIQYLENSSTNAMYSSMTRRFKECVDECLRPEVALNPQMSEDEHEDWYNSLESLRKSFGKTYSYSADIRCYDRSQEHVGLRLDLEFYRRHGLSEERLKIWEATHGSKRATAMMYGVVLVMVLGGVSGLWKTLTRNGVIHLAAFLVSTNVSRRDIVTLDIKGDDIDAELSRPVQVETAIERMSLTYNLSAKFFTNDVRYMCKSFRIRRDGRWYFMADPWARTQSLCTPIWIGNKEDDLKERWVSMRADLRHYDDGVLVDMVAEAAQKYYSTERPLYGMARGLSVIANDFHKFSMMFKPPERVD